jgi:subtilisin family serine protease
MAAPLVAGEAALVRAAHPDFTAVEVVSQIISKTEGIHGPVSKRIDAAAALDIPILSEYQCRGSVSLITVDTFIVPKGAVCNLPRAYIKGTVKVEEGATLNASSLYVKGSIQAKKSASANISDSVVDGSLEVEEGGSARLQRTQIQGDAKFFKNRGSLWISNNTIKGNLQCKENRLRPTGGGNLVQGNKEAQCSGL